MFGRTSLLRRRLELSRRSSFPARLLQLPAGRCTDLIPTRSPLARLDIHAPLPGGLHGLQTPVLHRSSSAPHRHFGTIALPRCHTDLAKISLPLTPHHFRIHAPDPLRPDTAPPPLPQEPPAFPG